eukprot:TRINITY_DN41750_c0_g1_i1.p1 TRINITY_DN41750_c0_g1~~TRINITY_DN41750_c0_g1_i1.p1  ORF type:complete len:163 (+),score=21.51 TRINITY_DN41750_c0_g1_i1:69-491(+)
MGIMCSFQAFFELIALAASIHGRETRKTIVTPADDNTVKYTTEITTHPFWDPSQGVQYQAKSIMMLVSPLVMIFAAVLAYNSYNCFTSFLFEEHDMESSGPMYARGSGLGGYGAARPEAPYRQTPQTSRIFQGSGQRLGS